MSDPAITFKPEQLCDYFFQICRVPHCSTRPGKCGSEDAVRNLVIDIVNKYNQANPGKIDIVHYDPKATDPGQRCIVLRRNPDIGMEDKETIILQGHMDMVCVPNCDIYPIEWETYEKKGVKKLTGFHMKGTEKIKTTLGADDGIGIAAALSIITDPKGQYGPIECFFSVQEETNMGGAAGFDPQWLTGRKLINLDSETDNEITFGSAGGSETDIHLFPEITDMGSHDVAVEVKVFGLKSGHSGVDIDMGRGNALKIAAQVLQRIRQIDGIAVNIVSFTTANDKTNAIPGNASITVTLPGDAFARFQSACDEYMNLNQTYYRATDPDMKWSVEQIKYSGRTMTVATSYKLISLILALPTGPVKMLPDPADVVETSTNLAIVAAEVTGQTGKIQVTCSNRSASDAALADLETLQANIAKMFGIRMIFQLDLKDPHDIFQEGYQIEKSGMIVISGRYPGWMPEPKSKLLEVAKIVYHQIYDGNYTCNVVHAGLECGWIMEKFQGKGMECIAIGPTIRDPHTKDENLDIASVDSFYQSIIGILEEIWYPSI